MQVDTFFLTLLINPRNIISNIIMLLNINATRGPTDCCSARLLGCGKRSPLYLIGDAASLVDFHG